MTFDVYGYHGDSSGQPWVSLGPLELKSGAEEIERERPFLPPPPPPLRYTYLKKTILSKMVRSWTPTRFMVRYPTPSPLVNPRLKTVLNPCWNTTMQSLPRLNGTQCHRIPYGSRQCTLVYLAWNPFAPLDTTPTITHG